MRTVVVVMIVVISNSSGGFGGPVNRETTTTEGLDTNDRVAVHRATGWVYDFSINMTSTTWVARRGDSNFGLIDVLGSGDRVTVKRKVWIP